jgi:predicted transcriptional regulator
MKDSIVNNPNEEDFLKQLKAEIEEGKLDLENGDFIRHEEVVEELKRKKLFKHNS